MSDNSLGFESNLGVCKSCARIRLNTSAEEGELLPSGTLKVSFDWRDTSDGEDVRMRHDESPRKNTQR
jgi:hypothetical protein